MRSIVFKLLLGLSLTTATSLQAAEGTASVTILVPVGATLYINGQPTHQMTAERRFVTPLLPEGKQFLYKLEASYTWYGDEVTKRKSIIVSAGATVRVDLSEAETVVNPPEAVQPQEPPAKAEPKPAPKPESKPAPKPEPKVEAELKPQFKPMPEPNLPVFNNPPETKAPSSPASAVDQPKPEKPPEPERKTPEPQPANVEPQRQLAPPPREAKTNKGK